MSLSDSFGQHKLSYLYKKSLPPHNRNEYHRIVPNFNNSALILFYMNKIPALILLLTHFRIFPSHLGMPIESEIIVRF